MEAGLEAWAEWHPMLLQHPYDASMAVVTSQKLRHDFKLHFYVLCVLNFFEV